MTPEEVRAHYAEMGWLGRPEADPLRRLAERRVAEVLRAASGGPKPADRPSPPWFHPARGKVIDGPQPSSSV